MDWLSSGNVLRYDQSYKIADVLLEDVFPSMHDRAWPNICSGFKLQKPAPKRKNCEFKIP